MSTSFTFIVTTVFFFFCATLFSAETKAPQESPFRYGAIPYGKTPDEFIAMTKMGGGKTRVMDSVNFRPFQFSGAMRYFSGGIYGGDLFTLLHSKIVQEIVFEPDVNAFPSGSAYF